MPIYALLYIIAILGFALIAVIGATLFQQGPCEGRERNRNRLRKRG